MSTSDQTLALLTALDKGSEIVSNWILRAEDDTYWVKSGTVWVQTQVKAHANRVVSETYHLAWWVNQDGETKRLIDLTRMGEQNQWVKRILDNLPVTPYSDLNPSSAALWINTPAGEVWVGRGEPTTLPPQVRWTLQTAYAPAPGPTPKFDAFMAHAFPDEETREGILTILSLVLRGDAYEQKIPVFQGLGGTGKTTLATVLDVLLGDYATEVASTKFTKGADGRAHEEWIAELVGKRLVRIEELPDGAQISAHRLKALMSGGTMTARRLRKDRFKFAPCFTVMIATNVLPNVATTDTGISRRLRFVRMDNVLPLTGRAASALEFAEDLASTEGPAVLQKLIDRARAWDGVYPDMNSGERILLEQERSGVAQWLESKCIIGAGWTPTSLLLDDFQQWARVNNHADMHIDLIPFGQALATHASDASKTRRWTGTAPDKVQLMGWNITVVNRSHADHASFTEDGAEEWRQTA